MKLQASGPANLFKKRLWHRCFFSSEFCEIFNNTSFTEQVLLPASENSESYFW